MAQKHNAEYTEKPMTRDGRIQGPSRRYRRLRHPTFEASVWADKNPLLQRGEIGYEVDTHKVKVGDGVTYWNDLPYTYDEVGQPTSNADYQMGNAQGGWTTMSEAQQKAINSGATTTNIGQIATNTTNISNHVSNTNNPHNVTASQVGLGNVDNTSDADKPISTATQDALDLKANIADLGTAAYTDSSDYATSAQGALADSALQPGDNVSELVNDAGYLTQHQTLADLGITATASEINVLDGITASTTELNYTDGVTSNIQTQIDNKQPKSASAYNMGNSTGGWTAMSTAQQNAINSGATTTNIGQIATNTSNIADEITNRQNADNGLQSQIDAIVSKSDVVDIVGTYAELQAYDTSSLGNNDVVKVLDDSTHNDAQSYYRWVISGGVGSWVYIGSEAETYTKAETDALLNAKQDTISATDGITLTGTTLTNSGVRAVASGTANGTISVNTNGTSADVAVTGLGSAAYTNSSAYATAAQGTKADTAVQPGDLATVATTGQYSDLSGKPTIPAAQVNSDWNANSGVAQILNKPTLGTAAAADTTDFATAAQGALADTAVQPGNNVSDLTNDAGYLVMSDLTNFVTRTTAQTISGLKTFSADIALSGTTSIKNTTNGVSYTMMYRDTNGIHVGTSTQALLLAGSGTHPSFNGNNLALLSEIPTVPTTLAALTGDVDISSPTSGQHLVYDGAKWKNTNSAATVSWGGIGGTLSDQTDLQNALDAKADDSDVVHLAGAETITGVKTAPASDIQGSVLTTVNKNKAQNGYFQLGNGLIVQWGVATGNTAGTAKTITLPKAFTSGSTYSVVLANSSSTMGNASGVAGNRYSSSFTIVPANSQVLWIAIGY